MNFALRQIIRKKYGNGNEKGMPPQSSPRQNDEYECEKGE
jgi:hypothetical protein